MGLPSRECRLRGGLPSRECRSCRFVPSRECLLIFFTGTPGSTGCPEAWPYNARRADSTQGRGKLGFPCADQKRSLPVTSLPGVSDYRSLTYSQLRAKFYSQFLLSLLDQFC